MRKKTNVDHLEMLLDFVPPNELRRSLHKAFFAFLAAQNEGDMDNEYSKVVEDYYFIFDFLDKLEL